MLRDNPALLLVGPKCESKKGKASIQQAESAGKANSVSEVVLESVCTILRFLSNLLRNSTNKSVFNSVQELSDLLAAANDNISSLALEVLASLSCPPMLHRQQAPEMQQHTTALHTVSSSCGVHARLMALARGWGSRGSGLGLSACVSADDSLASQESLPKYAGEMTFEFFDDKVSKEFVQSKPFSEKSDDTLIQDKNVTRTGNSTSRSQPSRLVRIHLSAEEILDRPNHQAEKRRRMGAGSTTHKISSGGSDSPSFASLFCSTKSTSDLFFQSIEKAGGRHRFPQDKAFLLLVQIRLARSFYSRQSRISAVELRLRALICVIHANPSHDILAGYFHAQPELCVELVDLIRPTVSPNSVSSALPNKHDNPSLFSRKKNETISSPSAISALAACSLIPYTVRALAIETLTALVARRDGAAGGLTNVARQANVLGELGVGKGQFLGLLPTLIRYSLASLNAFLSRSSICLKNKENKTEKSVAEMNDCDLVGLNLGLSFVQATKPPPLPTQVQEENAFEFIDTVLTLTSAVVSVPSGTAALTECGLIPALVSTVALDLQMSQISTENEEDSYAGCLLKFISAQAVQILEGAIATHSNALSAFHDLQGVNLLVTRLYLDVEQVRKEGGDEPFPTSILPGKKLNSALNVDNKLINDTEKQDERKTNKLYVSNKRPLKAAKRVLLFSIVNCLTVVFHQQDSSSSPSSTPPGGIQLRKPELTFALMDIMDNVDSYGGVMAALTATLLSDVMNADPQVVHHVHKSGLATSFLGMLMDNKNNKIEGSNTFDWQIPKLPQSSELIMAVPNVIAALSLTEDGAKKVKELNPFPDLLAIFCSPSYAMPKSRCLLNDMAAIVGTGLDEIMRHIPSFKPLIMRSIVKSMHIIVKLGKDLMYEESEISKERSQEMEESRSCLIQYSYNIGQMLEQVLHNEEHSSPFMDAGGIEAILNMYPILIPNGRQLLSHVSCISSPSLSSLTHSTTTNALATAIKSIAAHNDAHKVMRKLTEFIRKQLKQLGKSQKDLRKSIESSKVQKKNFTKVDTSGIMEEIDISGVLVGVPHVALHLLKEQDSAFKLLSPLSYFLRDILSVEWVTNVFSSIVRVACQRSHGLGPGWGRNENEWQKEISSKSFQQTFKLLSLLHHSTVHEVCRIRTEVGFEIREKERWKPHSDHHQLPQNYRLRIVCSEGAVVRNGIEIDSCESIGGLEMGEIVNAFDRCINTSGIMRYRTCRGWLSEQTRGHGREPIAEVLSIEGVCKDSSKHLISENEMPKRIECGIPDLSSVCASVLIRLQSSHTSLCASMSRAIMAGTRSLPSSKISFQQETQGAYVRNLLQMLSRSIQFSFKIVMESSILFDPQKNFKEEGLSHDGISLFLGSMLNTLHSCLYEEKRERQVLNLPLLVKLLYCNGFTDGLCDFDEMEANTGNKDLPREGFLGAIRFVIKHGLLDMANIAKQNINLIEDKTLEKDTSFNFCNTRQRMSRSVAASLPPAIALMQRLTIRSILVDSQISSVLSRVKGDLEGLLSESECISKEKNDNCTMCFHPVRFARALHCNIASIASEFLNDPLLILAPSHVLYPTLSFFGDLMQCMEDSTKKKSSEADTTQADNTAIEIGTDRPRDITELRRLSRNLSVMTSTLLGNVPSRASRRSEETSNRREGVLAEASASSPDLPSPLFEANEETVNLLMEMGFSREHAVEAIEMSMSNRLEIAMEYALAHPPPSAAAIEIRRAAREARRQTAIESTASVANTALSQPSEEPTDEVNINTNRYSVLQENNESSTNADSSVPENNEQSSESKPKEIIKKLTDEEKSSERQKEREKLSVSFALEQLKSLRDDMMKISLNIIECDETSLTPIINICDNDDLNSIKVNLNSNENESVTTVVCSFLLDQCEKYPATRSNMIVEILHRLKSCLEFEPKGSNCRVINGRECQFASMCHTSVIFLRALPRTRPILLKFNLVGGLIQCLKTFSNTIRQSSDAVALSWPEWVSPILLLLDIMAQPTSITLDCDDKELEDAISVIDAIKDVTEDIEQGEFSRLCAEHKKDTEVLSKAAKIIFHAVNENPIPIKKEKGQDEDKSALAQKDGEKCPTLHLNDVKEANSCQRDNKSNVALPSIPTLLPLMTQGSTDASVTICLQLLRYQQKRHENLEESKKPNFHIPADVVHATLLLLTRLLRSHKVAYQCLRMGGVELLLSLNAKSRFVGHAGLITVALRRMLEDEVTLQTAMESEIRSTVTKLHKKQARGVENETPKVTSRIFVQSVAPLICRDPLVFLKASATSVQIELPTGEERANRQGRVLLLTNEERMKNRKALIDCFKTTSISISDHNNLAATSSNISQVTVASGAKVTPKSGSSLATVNLKRGRQLNKSKSPLNSKYKSKSPHKHGNTKKIPKRERQEQNKKRSINLQGSPANHIISLLFSEMLKTTEKENVEELKEHSSFLCVVDYLEIIADLVLAVPACAAAIHRYHPLDTKEGDVTQQSISSLQHALCACPPPPNNAVSYLLHKFLPHPRIYPSKNDESTFHRYKLSSKIDKNAELTKKRCAYRKIKVSQSTARLLVALVARAGEGRRRVIFDLALALNGGGQEQLNCGLLPQIVKHDDEDHEMWALQVSFWISIQKQELNL